MIYFDKLYKLSSNSSSVGLIRFWSYQIIRNFKMMKIIIITSKITTTATNFNQQPWYLQDLNKMFSDGTLQRWNQQTVLEFVKSYSMTWSVGFNRPNLIFIFGPWKKKSSSFSLESSIESIMKRRITVKTCWSLKLTWTTSQ